MSLQLIAMVVHVCYCLQSDGDMYFDNQSKGNILKYEQGDKLGLLVNMEEKTM